jgi:hypothetical protein
MNRVAPFLRMRQRDLRDALVGGRSIDPKRIEGHEYRGVSLGLPAWMEKLSWKIFRKTFHRDPTTGELRGWNVRMRQVEGGDLLAASTPLEKHGLPRAFGFYRVVPCEGRALPVRVPQGLLIDYGARGGGSFRTMRDPLVAIDGDACDVLLGWSYMDLGFARIGTPSYFLLVREGPISYVPPLP